MKFNYKPGEENYIEFLKKKIWVKKKKKEKEDVKILSLDELNK